jgi:hypothetical protein
VPAKGDLSVSEAKVRNTSFLDDFERAVRPFDFVSICENPEGADLLTTPHAKLSDNHEWLLLHGGCESTGSQAAIEDWSLKGTTLLVI